MSCRCSTVPGQGATEAALSLKQEVPMTSHHPGLTLPLMPGPVLNPPTAPMCPTGRAPRLARRPQTVGTSHRSPSQRTPPRRAPQRCPRPRTGWGSGHTGLGACGWWAHPFHPRLGLGLPHQGAGRPGHSLRSSCGTPAARVWHSAVTWASTTPASWSDGPITQLYKLFPDSEGQRKTELGIR